MLGCRAILLGGVLVVVLAAIILPSPVVVAFALLRLAWRKKALHQKEALQVSALLAMLAPLWKRVSEDGEEHLMRAEDVRNITIILK